MTSKEILKQMHEIASSPRAQMDRFLAEGTPVVLTVPVYTPEEIVHSMGFVPMGAWGADIPLNRAKEYCPAFLCSIVQSVLELGIEGKYQGASAILIPSLCDTLKTLGQNWKYAVTDIPFIPMTYPQNRKPDDGIAFTKAGYQRVIRDLEALGGTFSEEALAESIRIYNEHNAVMRMADHVFASRPEITAGQRSDVFKSAFFMKKEDHTAMVRQLLDALEIEEGTKKGTGIPVLISGILADSPELNAIFDDLGFRIVADDVAAQSRQYRTDTPAGGTALDALAMKFAQMDNCSVLYNAEKPRVNWITDTAKERGARGVVIIMTKFCDPEEFDYVLIRRACEKAKLPVTLIEVDRQMVQFEQIRTNLETFRDLIQMEF
ncbi:MAG: 2-hydroxyacyl-CoA dehydratase [Mogibacterium sp.]|nr:2-hydroxyacyl-CoA dehydratase [Mogibacterium sp.]